MTGHRPVPGNPPVPTDGSRVDVDGYGSGTDGEIVYRKLTPSIRAPRITSSDVDVPTDEPPRIVRAGNAKTGRR